MNTLREKDILNDLRASQAWKLVKAELFTRYLRIAAQVLVTDATPESASKIAFLQGEADALSRLTGQGLYFTENGMDIIDQMIEDRASADYEMPSENPEETLDQEYAPRPIL
jgi:hypothetical protein